MKAKATRAAEARNNWSSTSTSNTMATEWDHYSTPTAATTTTMGDFERPTPPMAPQWEQAFPPAPAVDEEAPSDFMEYLTPSRMQALVDAIAAAAAATAAPLPPPLPPAATTYGAVGEPMHSGVDITTTTSGGGAGGAAGAVAAPVTPPRQHTTNNAAAGGVADGGFSTPTNNGGDVSDATTVAGSSQRTPPYSTAKPSPASSPTAGAATVALQSTELDMEHVTTGDEQLGAGAFGVVYQGTYTAPGAEPEAVAVKRLNLQKLDAKLVKSFIDEAKVMAVLTRHPNVVRFVGQCSKPGNICIVTELCAGGNLEDYACSADDSRAALTPAQRRSLAVGIAEGMQWIHANRIVHKDLKPLNGAVCKVPRVCMWVCVRGAVCECCCCCCCFVLLLGSKCHLRLATRSPFADV